VNGIITLAPTDAKYATQVASHKYELRRWSTKMADTSVTSFDLQVWPEFCLITGMKSTVARGQTKKNMEFVYNVDVDD